MAVERIDRERAQRIRSIPRLAEKRWARASSARVFRSTRIIRSRWKCSDRDRNSRTFQFGNSRRSVVDARDERCISARVTQGETRPGFTIKETPTSKLPVVQSSVNSSPSWRSTNARRRCWEFPDTPERKVERKRAVPCVLEPEPCWSNFYRCERAPGNFQRVLESFRALADYHAASRIRRIERDTRYVALGTSVSHGTLGNFNPARGFRLFIRQSRL